MHYTSEVGSLVPSSRQLAVERIDGSGELMRYGSGSHGVQVDIRALGSMISATVLCKPENYQQDSLGGPCNHVRH